MQLSQIDIRNFRNLKKVTVQVGPGLNVLVGANNAGKTNLFEAIHCALGPFSSRSDPIRLEWEDLYVESRASDTEAEPAEEQKDDSDFKICIRLTFVGLNDSERAHFFEIVDFPSAANIEDAPARINCEAVWDEGKKKFKTTRWGGAWEGDRSQVPQEILESLPLILLPALRDAESALTPGSRSMLARVLEDLAKKNPGNHEEEIEEIFREANDALEDQSLISALQKSLRKSTEQMAGTIYSRASVRAAPPVFRKILKTLRVVLEDAPVEEVHRTGMGYSNLLFIGALLAYLSEPAAPECPILLVEEPEAHLNPQLTLLLAEHLSELDLPQILVSTHSPTFAANVTPSQIVTLFKKGGEPVCRSLANTGMTPKEERQLQRLLDITRASLYFAKGIILVEGISEALLIPELARKMGVDLKKHHVSVIPICGVEFGTFSKLFSENGLAVPVSIITDSDPPVLTVKGKGWEFDTPDFGKKADRLAKLEEYFAEREFVSIQTAKVTLEYDLALAGKDNPTIMAEAWASCFQGRPGTFNTNIIEGKDLEEKALLTWRGICRSSSKGSKAEFAHMLASRLQEDSCAAAEDSAEDAQDSLDFTVPKYIKNAIRHVVPVINS